MSSFAVTFGHDVKRKAAGKATDVVERLRGAVLNLELCWKKLHPAVRKKLGTVTVVLHPDGEDHEAVAMTLDDDGAISHMEVHGLEVTLTETDGVFVLDVKGGKVDDRYILKTPPRGKRRVVLVNYDGSE